MEEDEQMGKPLAAFEIIEPLITVRHRIIPWCGFKNTDQTSVC